MEKAERVSCWEDRLFDIIFFVFLLYQTFLRKMANNILIITDPKVQYGIGFLYIVLELK